MLLAAVVLPFSTAAAPAAVEGISVRAENGNALVQWQPVENAERYRVYYSNQSILDNNGVYDDFVETEGATTEVTLDGERLSNRVFVSVLAVDDAGEESSVFLEESSALLSGGSISSDGVQLDDAELSTNSSTDSTSSADADTFVVTGPTEQRSSASASTGEQVPAWEQPTDDGMLHLLLAEAESPTDVLLHFNVPPTVQPEQAPKAFTIVDADGRELPITSIYIKGKYITVRTETQVSDQVYQVRLSEPLMTAAGGPLHARDRTVVFRGHAGGTQDAPKPTTGTRSSQSSVTSSTPPSVPQPSCDPADVEQPPKISNLRLRSRRQADGNYVVQAQWSVNMHNCNDRLLYLVRQSSDRGNTFTQPQTVPVDIAGLRIPNVQPGEYGLGISVINSRGYVSQEMFDSITLPGERPTQPTTPPTTSQPPPTQTPPTASTTQPPSSGRLSSSGAGMAAGGMAALGAAAAWWRKKKGTKGT